MSITIKKYEKIDENQFKQLLKVCFEDEVLLNLIKSDKLVFAFSAFFENRLVGVTFAWKSSFHPFCTYFRILSHPFYHSLKVEEQLLVKVVEMKSEKVPLQTSVWETSNALVELFKNNGFKEIRRTYTPTLKVSDTLDFSTTLNTNHPIKTLAEILMDKLLTEELTQLVKRNYEKTHMANPVANFDVEQWFEMITTDDIVQDGSYIYLDKSEKSILAYSFLHESDKRNTLELGWCGAVNSEQQPLIPELFQNQVKYARKHNFHFVLGEFDTTDSDALTILNNFPFAPSPTWITFQKK